MQCFSFRGPRLLWLLPCLYLVLSAGASQSEASSEKGLELETLVGVGMALAAPKGMHPVLETQEDATAFLIRMGLRADSAASSFLYADKGADEEETLAIKTVQKVASLETNGGELRTLNWDLFSAGIVLEGVPFPRGRDAAGNRWTLANLIGGTGHFHQGIALAFPQSFLSPEEMGELLSLLGPVAPEEPFVAEGGDGLMALDVVLRKTHDWKWRISCYYAPIGDRYQAVLAFNITASGFDYAP